MKIFNWPKDGQEDIDPAILKRFNININDLKENEDLVEDSDEETEDDEFVSIDELEEDSDEEDKYQVDDMKNNKRNKNQQRNCCNGTDRVLTDLFKRQMQNRKLSDSEVVENLSRVIIAAFRRAKEELASESPAQDLFSALEDYSDPYTDDFEEPTFPESSSEDFFYVPKTEKQVKRESYNTTAAKTIGALITLYMRQGKIERMFMKVTDLNQFYYDLNEMNLILVGSVLNVLKRTGNEKTNQYLNHVNKVISQMSKISNPVQKLKFYLKAVNLWRNQRGPKFADIAYKTFVDNSQVEEILSKYQLAILPEEFSKMMSGILNQMIF